MDDPYDLQRFVEAQDRTGGYERALGEIRSGTKETHWIWWIFPQLAGLGLSSTSREYSISSLAEAEAYFRHPVLGSRLRDVTAAMNGHSGLTASSILHRDDVKFRSSMTLFMRAAPTEPLFRDAIDTFFNAEPDARTDELLERHV